MTPSIDAPVRAICHKRPTTRELVIGLILSTALCGVAAQTPNPSPSPSTSPTATAAPLSAEATEAAEAMKRSRRQAENPYRWIKMHADTKRKTEAPKPRPKNEPSATEAAKSEPRTPTAASPTLESTAPEVTATSANPPSGPAVGSATAAPEPVSATGVSPSTAPQTAAANAPPEDDTDGELKPISTPPPEFPRGLRDTVVEGKVVVAFTVQPDGSVGEVSAESSSNRRLSKAALDAVAKWKFEPIASAATYKVEIQFNQQ